MKVFAALAALAVLSWSRPASAACGYEACPPLQADKINVHLVPHSHDDVGWLKTVDQYYYGSKSRIQQAGVQYILDSVVQELLKDPKRRFIYVESAFFFKWYHEQSREMQSLVRDLVESGRLEFAGGAWSMNDEAAVHYQSVIDQFTLGLKALWDAFGKCGRPRIGWQIDPFGHSREMASLLAQMGYDGEFFARIDWVEKKVRLSNRTAELIWKASDNLGERADLFAGLLYNHYASPPGFCFDGPCHDDPIIDGDSYDNNVNEKVETFLAYVEDMAANYRSPHLIVPMGDDFTYENAVINFKNLDKLIKYVNARQMNGSRINLLYSTPACYLKAVYELNLTWPTKTQDFFPYASDWQTYWTGFYSSRPTQKRFEREGNHFLQVAKQLTTIANLSSSEATRNLDRLRQVMGILQHHDAITGTEKQPVACDYNRLLADALARAQTNTRQALRKLTNLTYGEFESCLQLNISLCEFTRNGANNVVVTLFNPLTHSTVQAVRVPVSSGSYVVTDALGRVIRSQVVPVPRPVLDLPFRPKYTKYELVFQAHVEKLANYYVGLKARPRPFDFELETNRILMEEPKFETSSSVARRKGRAAGDIVVKNSLVRLTFSRTGFLTNVEMNGVSEDIKQEFYYYQAAVGNNAQYRNRSSGAYAFRPNGTEQLIGRKVELTVYDGPVVKEVHQRFSDWVSQVVRLYEGVNRVEFEWLVGPIPVQDKIGKEVIMRFTSSLASQGVFWTDSNGREMLRRVRNEREGFKPDMTEKVSGNYYPITTRIALQSQQRRIALLNDRPQGGSSLRDGVLELMLHRRLLHDDNFGVGEALNEIAHGRGLVARGKVYLILSQVAGKPTVLERLAQQEVHLPLWKFFSNSLRSTPGVVPEMPNLSSLPQSVQILTLEPFSEKEHLLRLEHFMDRNEGARETFNIRSLFDALAGKEIRETTLDGNMPLSAMRRFKFQPDGGETTTVSHYTSPHVPLYAETQDSFDRFTIDLDPMQIRTFIIRWK